MKRILVAYASKSGTTKQVAQRLARALAPECDLYDLRSATMHTLSGTSARLPLRSLDFSAYQGVALGSAMYMGRPLKPFLRVCQERAGELTRQPLFLFTVGIANKQEEQSYLWPLLPQAITEHAKDLYHLGGELHAERGFMHRMVLKDYEKKNLPAPALDDAAIGQLSEALKQ